MASIRARDLAMRQRSSHQSGGPTAAPSSLKLADPFQLQPGKLPNPKKIRRGACWDDLRFPQIDRKTDAAEVLDKGRKEEAHGGRGARANAIVKIEGAYVEARWEGALSSLSSLQSKEDKPQRVALLHSLGAGNNLITSSAGAREKMAIVAITAVHPWSERRKVGADGLKDSGAMHCVEGVGHFH